MSAWRTELFPSLTLTESDGAISLTSRMREIPVASLDPRHQKLIENARVALDRGNLDYVVEVTAQVLKTQPGCLPVRRLQRVAQLRAARAKGSGFMSKMTAGLSAAPFMFGAGKRDPA